MNQQQASGPTPFRVLLTVLLVVFLAELAVMFLLPLMLPASVAAWPAALLDACLLTAATSPLLWWVIIRPLRQIAATERAKAASIVETAAEGIITINEQGIVESFNRAAEEIFECPAEEIVGSELTTLMPQRVAVQHREAMLRYLETGQALLTRKTVEVTGQRRDGSEVPLELSISAVRISGRRLFTGIIRDLTERERLEEERHRRARQQVAVAELGRNAMACEDLSQLLTEAASSVVDVLDFEYCLISQLLPDDQTMLMQAGAGWDNELVGKATLNVSQLSPPDSNLLADEPVLVADFLALPPEKRPPWFHKYHVASGMSVLIRGGQRPFGILGAYTTRPREIVADDVHFLQNVAIEITLAIQRLEVELQRRERDSLRAEQAAAVAQLATGVAHEIRNPLTSVKMLVQAAMQDDGRNTIAPGDLQMIEGEIRRMERSLQTFLDFARPPKPERRELELSDLVERTFALSGARAAKQSVTLNFRRPDASVLIYADWEQIQQLLMNLVFNGLDAMPHGGELVVEMKNLTETEVRLQVLDTGPGIASQVLPQLFQPFVTAKETGVGLGLVISRRIAEDHGGSLTAQNRPEGGACFILKLPTVKPRARSADRPDSIS